MTIKNLIEEATFDENNPAAERQANLLPNVLKEVLMGRTGIMNLQVTTVGNPSPSQVKVKVHIPTSGDHRNDRIRGTLVGLNAASPMFMALVNRSLARESGSPSALTELTCSLANAIAQRPPGLIVAGVVPIGLTVTEAPTRLPGAKGYQVKPDADVPADATAGSRITLEPTVTDGFVGYETFLGGVGLLNLDFSARLVGQWQPEGTDIVDGTWLSSSDLAQRTATLTRNNEAMGQRVELKPFVDGPNVMVLRSHLSVGEGIGHSVELLEAAGEIRGFLITDWTAVQATGYASNPTERLLFRNTTGATIRQGTVIADLIVLGSSLAQT